MRFRRRIFYFRIKYNFKKYILLILLILLLFYLYNLYVNSFKPLVLSVAESKASLIATKSINDTIKEVMDNNGFENLVTLVKDNNGNVTAVISNIVTINRLKSEIATKIQDKVANIGQTEIFIPLGNILNTELLSGIGPRIPVKVLVVGYSDISFKNTFNQAGINQTKNEIFLDISSTVVALLPNKLSKSTSVSVTVPVAETIIVGNVPNTYTNIDTPNENLRRDLVNMAPGNQSKN